MDAQEIQSKIQSFPRWHYQFELKGQLTPVWNKTEILRHKARREFFFDALVRINGGSLDGKRVLDLGCNAGFWSLCAIEAGADFALGIDGRQVHIDQANFVFEAKEIDPSKYQFIVGDVSELALQDFGQFDIVLCLGLLHHLSDPIGLLEQVASINSDVLVIDSFVSRVPGSYLELRIDDQRDPRKAVGHSLVLAPTKRAVFDMVGRCGYDSVLLKPRFQLGRGPRDYVMGLRCVFFCAKHANLVGASLPTQSLTMWTQTIDTALWAAQRTARVIQKRIGRLG